MKIQQFDKTGNIVNTKIPPLTKIAEDTFQIPEIGNAIRTKKSDTEGKVERLGNNEVFFRLADGRLMKTPLENVIVIEKLADEDDKILEYTEVPLDKEAYLAKRRELQRIQMDPETSRDPMLKAKLAKAVAKLNKDAQQAGLLPKITAETSLNEISNELLARYKTAAGKDASNADKKGDFKKGNKRFSGIVKATNKEFDNDAKKRNRSTKINELSSDTLMRYIPAATADRTRVSADQKSRGKWDPAVVNKMDKRGGSTIRAYNKLKSLGEDSNPEDTITVDVPLLIRIMEYAKEDAKTDMDLHKVAENLVRMSSEGRTLNMKDYNAMINGVDEGTMGGINRSAPSNDVSYQNVLDNTKDTWKGNTVAVNELSNDKMSAYKDAASSEEQFRKRPMWKLSKSVQGVGRANDKIQKNNSKSQYKTFEERLSNFLEEDIKATFGDILSKQKAEEPPKQKSKPVEIPYNGFTIKYRPAAYANEKVKWIALDKRGNQVAQGEATTNKDAVAAGQSWVNTGGAQTTATKSVTLDFNVDFAREFAPGGETFYVKIEKNGNIPVLKISYEPQEGFKKSSIRTVKSAQTGTTTLLPAISLGPKESNVMGLQANGRYTLDNKHVVDDNTVTFQLKYNSRSQNKTDTLQLKEPGLTVATSRD